jgi:hypothetical protein
MLYAPMIPVVHLCNTGLLQKKQKFPTFYRNRRIIDRLLFSICLYMSKLQMFSNGSSKLHESKSASTLDWPLNRPEHSTDTLATKRSGSNAL